MKKKLRIRLEHRSDQWLWAPDVPNQPVATTVNRLRLADLQIPACDYTVEYTLAPKSGEWLVRGMFGGMLIRKYSPSGWHCCTVNCFLPPEWDGLRVNRRIVKRGYLPTPVDVNF